MGSFQRRWFLGNVTGEQLRRCGLPVATLMGLFLLAACSGGGGGGGTGSENPTGAGSGGDLVFQDANGTVDDRYVGTGEGGDGTGSVAHVEIIHLLPGGDPALDVVTSAADLGN